jgi:hypothetical protein
MGLAKDVKKSATGRVLGLMSMAFTEKVLRGTLVSDPIVRWLLFNTIVVSVKPS